MPQRKCALKRLKVDKKKHSMNIKNQRELKKTIKSFLSLLNQKKIEEAKTSLNQVISKIDRAVSKGILHKNNAARKKSALVKRLQALSK